MNPVFLPLPLTSAAVQIGFTQEKSEGLSSRAHRQETNPNLASLREAVADQNRMQQPIPQKHRFINNHSLMNGGHPYGSERFSLLPSKVRYQSI